jgi:hypothetical protein
MKVRFTGIASIFELALCEKPGEAVCFWVISGFVLLAVWALAPVLYKQQDNRGYRPNG